MSNKVVVALGPGSSLADLDKSLTSYETASKKFSELLQYPFLQSIVLGEGDKNGEDLRTIVADGSSRFGQLCTTNISIAQQVISYGRTVPVLLKAMTVADYAVNIKPLVAQYVAEAITSSNGNEQVFEDVSGHLGS